MPSVSGTLLSLFGVLPGYVEVSVGTRPAMEVTPRSMRWFMVVQPVSVEVSKLGLVNSLVKLTRRG